MQEDNSQPIDIQEIILRLERLIEYFERKNRESKIHDEKECPYSPTNRK